MVAYQNSVISYLVIPSGATSGERIVINGVAGTITLYDANNNPTVVLANGEIIVGYLPHSQVVLNANGVDQLGNSVAQISFPTNNATEIQAGAIYSSYFSLIDTNNMVIQGPASNETATADGYYREVYSAGGDSGTTGPVWTLQYVDPSSPTPYNNVLSAGGSASRFNVTMETLTVSAGIVLNSNVWDQLILDNGWTNFGGNFDLAECILDSSGFVHLRGVIKPGAIADGTVVATLPNSKYYPHNWKFMTILNDGANTNTRVEIPSSTGNITIFGLGAAADLSFDGMVFESGLYYPNN